VTTVLCLAAIALSLAAARGVRGWPARRTATLVGGLAVAGAAVRLPDEPLPAHMGQHAALAMLAAPLIAAGSPLLLALRRLTPARRAAVARALARLRRSPLGHPALSWGLLVGAMWGLHTLPAIRLAERSEAFHALDHTLLLAAAVAFWMPVLAAGPALARLRGGGRCLYLLAAMPATEGIAMYLASSGEPSAGAAMGAGMLPLGLVFAAVTWRWLAAQERRARGWEALCEARGWEAYG
jgi:cytochrome c oxidase assembly factor CtaG